MARVQYGEMITALRGSLSGNSFQRNASGEIVRSRAVRAKQSTPRMTNAQLSQANWINVWRSIGLSHQANWNTFALAHTRDDLFGRTKNLSGFNWFNTINANRAIAGNAFLEDPPDYVLPDFNDTLDVVLIGAALGINYTLVSLTVETWLGILLTPPLQNTTTSFRQASRLVYTAPATAAEDLDLASQWSAYFDLPFPPSDPASFRIGALLYTINADTGLTSSGQLRIGQWEP